MKSAIYKESNSYQALWVGLGTLSSFALTMVSTVVLSRLFEKAEYGTYRQILFVYNSLLVVFSAQLPKVFAFYLPKYKLEEGKAVVAKITLLLFLAGCLFSSFIYFGSDAIAVFLNNVELSKGLKYFAPVPMLLFPTLGLQGILSTYKKTQYLAFYQVTTRIIMLLFIVVPVLFLGNSYIFAIYGWIGASILSLFIALYFKSLPFKGIAKERSDLKIRQILSYSLPIALASLAGIAIKSSDQFFISRYFGVEVFAEFANGFVPIPLVTMVTSATSVVLMPVFSKLVEADDNLVELVSIWKSALLKSAMVIYPVVFFMFFHAETIIRILYGEIYVNSASFFRISMLVNLFNIIVFSPLLLSLGKSKFYATIHIVGAIAAWVVGYYLVIIFRNPYVLAGWSTLLSILIVITGFVGSSHFINIGLGKLIPVKDIFRLLLHLTVVTLILYLSKYIVSYDNLIIDLIVNAILFGVLVLNTGKYFRLNYFIVIRPLFNKMHKSES